MTANIYSCFISYRHPAISGGLEEKLIRHVVTAVKDHIAVYTHKYEVYFDEDRLIPGYEYNENLAKALCRSACMIVVYWPSYLESDYCRKEIETMLDIEETRRRILGRQLHGCRLFVPIIVHGDYEDLPQQMREGCQYLNYTAQSIRHDFNIGDDQDVSAKLYGIAKYVKSLCDKMSAVEDKLFNACDTFAFPQQPGGGSRVTSISIPSQLFPGR